MTSCVRAISAVFDGPVELMEAVLRGHCNLGRFVWDNIGFLEDLWPLIVVGEFVPKECLSDRTLYEIGTYKRRIVLDVRSRKALYQSRVPLGERVRRVIVEPV